MERGVKRERETEVLERSFLNMILSIFNKTWPTYNLLMLISKEIDVFKVYLELFLEKLPTVVLRNNFYPQKGFVPKPY